MKVYQQIAAWVRSYNETTDDYTSSLYRDFIRQLVQEYLPHGSGIDAGVEVDLLSSTTERLVLISSFHMMNDGGFYCGWWDFKVTVTPSLVSDFNMKVTAPKKDTHFLRDYLYESFDYALSLEVAEGFYAKIRTELKEALAARNCSKVFQ
jgi:hypothetical protein